MNVSSRTMSCKAAAAARRLRYLLCITDSLKRARTICHPSRVYQQLQAKHCRAEKARAMTAHMSEHFIPSDIGPAGHVPYRQEKMV
jgi:hypothetical protein